MQQNLSEKCIEWRWQFWHSKENQVNSPSSASTPPPFIAFLNSHLDRRRAKLLLSRGCVIPPRGASSRNLGGIKLLPNCVLILGCARPGYFRFCCFAVRRGIVVVPEGRRISATTGIRRAARGGTRGMTWGRTRRRKQAAVAASSAPRERARAAEGARHHQLLLRRRVVVALFSLRRRRRGCSRRIWPLKTRDRWIGH